jgi:mannitol 2-dehydrogenase
MQAMDAKDDPQIWTNMRQIYGDLGQNDQVSATFARLLRSVWDDGTAKALADYLAG